MKKLLLLMFLLAFTLSCGATNNSVNHPPPKIKKDVTQTELTLYNEVQWHSFDSRVFVRSKLQKKLILVFLYSPSCEFCYKMRRTTFLDPDVVNLMNNYFISSAVNGDEEPGVSEVLNEQHRYPTTAFLAPDGTYLISISGYMSAKEYNKALRGFLSVAKESGLSAP